MFYKPLLIALCLWLPFQAYCLVDLDFEMIGYYTWLTEAPEEVMLTFSNLNKLNVKIYLYPYDFQNVQPQLDIFYSKFLEINPHVDAKIIS